MAVARDDFRALVQLGVERRRRGDLPGAYEAILEARALAPRDAGVKQQLDRFPAWPSFRGGAGRTGASATRPPRRAPRIRWVQTKLDGTVHVSTPTAVAAASDRIFATTSREVYVEGSRGPVPARPCGNIYALDADDGTILWNHPVLGLPSAPTHAGELVLVVVWRGYDAPGEPAAGTALLALDVATGKVAFRVDLPAEEQTRPLAQVHPPLAVDGHVIMATTPFLIERGRAWIACADLRKGELAWRVERSRLEGDLAAAPDTVYARTVDRRGDMRLEALSVTDGKMRFSIPVGSGDQLIATEDRVFTLEEFPDDRLRCFDGKSGKFKWQLPGRGRRFFAPVVLEHEVLLPAENPRGTAYLHCVDIETGELLGHAPPATVSSQSGISAADGVIVGSLPGGGTVGLAHASFERPLWRERQIRCDPSAGEDLAVAHGRIFGIARSGVAFCLDERPAAN
ncbi:PQQ-binding-like beta-propeller repeat protein [bacterium]|nr:PQQ-binding-like beta-propeller repeat protein [bacterium]